MRELEETSFTFIDSSSQGKRMKSPMDTESQKPKKYSNTSCPSQIPFKSRKI